MEKQNQNVGNDLTVEINEGRVADDLLGYTGLGVSRDLEHEEVGLGLAVASDLDEAVGKSARLNDLSLERLPRGYLTNAGQPEDRIAVMLDEPLAALIVFVHWSISAGGMFSYSQAATSSTSQRQTSSARIGKNRLDSAEA
jgi:hypothetical protein